MKTILSDREKETLIADYLLTMHRDINSCISPDKEVFNKNLKRIGELFNSISTIK